MSVPNNSDFSNQDIYNEIGGGIEDMDSAFKNADILGFDPTYNKDSFAKKNSSLRFRNYAKNIIPIVITPELDNVANIKSLYVKPQDDTPNSLCFNTTGDKLFMLGLNSDRIYEYTLSTAFIIDSATYSNDFYIHSKVTAPTEITFNADGTRLFVIEQFADKVYQFDLPIPWNLGTLIYNDVKFSIQSEDKYPSGIAFSNDGMKMFIGGDDTDKIYQYSLSTSFNITTASYEHLFLSFDQDNRTMDFVFSSNGLRLFVLGNQNDKVYQYNLTTAFMINTASFSGKSFSPKEQDSALNGITISADNTKLYVAGNISDTIYQYDLQ